VVVVDASIALQWLARERHSEAAARLLGLERRLVAPDIMPVEVSNALWKKGRQGDLEPRSVGPAVRALVGSGVVLVPTLPLLPRAVDLATDLGLTVYDGIYLAASQNQGAMLATGDLHLARTARRLGLAVWRP
jgi:predicted nucleic acid-binding protein